MSINWPASGRINHLISDHVLFARSPIAVSQNYPI